MSLKAVVALLLFSLPVAAQESKYELPPEQRTGTIKRIFVVCHSHLDIGFTRPPDEVARDYKDNIDTAIRLTRENPDFRWTIESAWMLEEWLRRTSDQALVSELGTMLRDGRMSLGVAFANMHSGLMGAEESNRLVYSGEKFRRQFGIRGAVAFQNDVPGFTWAYPRIFAGSGVKWLINGLNLFIGGGNNLGVGKDPFYWIGPDGSRVLTYFTYDSYVEGSRWKLRRPLPDQRSRKVRAPPARLAGEERIQVRHLSVNGVAGRQHQSDGRTPHSGAHSRMERQTSRTAHEDGYPGGVFRISSQKIWRRFSVRLG